MFFFVLRWWFELTDYTRQIFYDVSSHTVKTRGWWHKRVFGWAQTASTKTVTHFTICVLCTAQVETVSLIVFMMHLFFNGAALLCTIDRHQRWMAR